MDAMAAPGTQWRTGRGTGILAATGLGLFMVFLDALIVNVALPDIQADLGGGETTLQWTVTAYSLGMAVSIMAAATLADRSGRRRVYLAGLGVFSMASLACALAPSAPLLDAARAVQGVAAGAVNVTSLALVSAAFTEEATKARAIGVWSAIAAAGIGIGPVLGGLLTDGFGWRAVFLVNVPIGVVAVLLTLRFVDESRDPVGRGYDPPGQLLYAAAVGALALGVIEGPHLGWGAPVVLGALLVAAVAGPAFVRHELRADDPMMDLRLFADRGYTLAIVTVFVVMVAVYGMFLLMGQLWQDVRGDSVLLAGLRLVPGALLLMVFSPVSGRWVGRVGARRVMRWGVSILCAAFAVQIIGLRVGDGVTALGVALVGLGEAFTLTPATTVAMASVPPGRAGMASGIMSAQRALGSTLGYALLGTVMVVGLGLSLGPALRPVVPDETARHAVERAVVDHANPRALPSELPAADRSGRDELDRMMVVPDEAVAAAERAFIDGISMALGLALVLLLGVVVADRRWAPPEPPHAAPTGG